MATCAMRPSCLSGPFCITPSACCLHTLTSLLAQSLVCAIAHFYIRLFLVTSWNVALEHFQLPHAAFPATLVVMICGH